MGQKINPYSLRLGINKEDPFNWKSRYFFRGSYRQLLEEDVLIRKIIDKKINPAGVVDIIIERTSDSCRITIVVARAGLVIGRGGQGIEDLTKTIEKAVKKLRLSQKRKEPFVLNINVEEINRNDVKAAYTAKQIAWDLEKRLPYRKAMKKYLEKIMSYKGVKGAKILLSGRLNGNEIARREWMRRGEMPLQTLMANVDYSQGVAYCTYGTIGVKVWIYKNDSDIKY